jgi:hypothetical protein
MLGRIAMMKLFDWMPGIAVTLGLIFFCMMIMPQPLYAEGPTWREDGMKAALAYAENQTREAVKANSKAAIIALNTRLYKTGANKKYSSSLARIALSTQEINQLAESTADALSSSDPNKVKAATEALSISLGNQLVKFSKDPALQGHLKSIMGKAGTVKEISGLLGAAGTKSGNRALAEYAGQTLIDLTPAAGVVGFYKSAYGAMKYTNDQFVSSEMEGLYKIYKKNAEHGEEDVSTLLDAGKKYGYIVRQRRMDLIAKTREMNLDADPPEKLIAHLSKSSDDDIKNEILAAFKKRKEKEENDAKQRAKKKAYIKEAEAILDTLDSVARNKLGQKWHENNRWQLNDFMSKVQKALEGDGVLDPRNLNHIKAMTRLKATHLMYTKNSPEYQEQIKQVKQLRSIILGRHVKGNCQDDAPRLARSLIKKGHRLIENNKPEQGFKHLQRSLKACNNPKLRSELSRMQKAYNEDKSAFLEKLAKKRKEKDMARQKAKRELIMKKLARLNHTKFLDVLKTLKLKTPDPYMNCLCSNAGYGSSSARAFYHPDTIGNFDKRYACQQPGEPCVVAGFGCLRYPLPSDTAISDKCKKLHRFNTTKTEDGKVDPDSGEQLDVYIEKKLAERIKEH